MRGLIWSELGHLGLPHLVTSTIMDASNSHVDGRVDTSLLCSDFSRLAVSLFEFEFEPLHRNGQ